MFSRYPVAAVCALLFSSPASFAQCTLAAQPNLPLGIVGVAYPGAIIHGGAGPWQYQITAGSLPPGLAISGSGGGANFSGLPSAAGSYDFSLSVTDSAGCSGAGSFRIVIGGALTVQPPLLGQGTVGRPFDEVLSLQSGDETLPVQTAGITLGVLPTGLALSASGGQWRLAGLPSIIGNFDFTIQLTGANGYSASRRYVVTIAGSTGLAVTPASIRLTTRLGDPPPPVQRIDVAADGGGRHRYRISSSSPNFRIDGASGELVTPFSLNLLLSTLAGAPGVYTGQVDIVPVDGVGVSVRVPVEFIVQPPPSLLLNTTSLAVHMRQNDPPVTRGIQVASSDSALSYTVEALTPIGGDWLALTPVMGETPATLTAVFNPVGMEPGNYPGTIRVSAQRNGIPAIGSPQTVAVTLVVDPATPTSGFAATPPALTFHGQVHAPNPPAQTVRIQNDGGPVTWNSGGNISWVSINPPNGTTPTDVSINVFTNGMGPGTHQGAITFTSAASQITVPITVVMDPPAPSNGDPTIRVTPNSVFGTVVPGSPTTSWVASVDGFGRALDLEFRPTVDWLAVTPQTGTTPASFQIIADGSKLRPGSHEGAVIVVTSNPNGIKTSTVVNVALFVGQPPASGPGALVLSTNSLSFDWRQGGTVPPSRKMFLTSSGGSSVNWEANSTVSWINLSAYSGKTPAELDISVSPQFLGAGNYRGEVRFRRGSEETGVLTVLLTISGAGALRADPSALVYLVETGREVAPQLFLLSRSGSETSTNFTLRSAPEWLSVTPPSGATPARLEAAIRRDRLPQATTSVIRMEGEIELESSAGGVRIPVLLTIVPPQGAPAGRELPWILSVTNAGSTLPGPAAPGMHAVLYGLFEGEDVKVFFDANRAPLLKREATALTVAVPFAVAGRASTRVRVEVDGLLSRDLEVRVVDLLPGIYTVNRSGRGLAVAWNADGSSNHEVGADAGSEVVVQLTGLGQTDPPGADGAAVEGDEPKVLADVEARLGGLTTEVLGCFTPAGEVHGVVRCHVRIPPGIEAGDHALLFTVGGVATQPGVQLRVK